MKNEMRKYIDKFSINEGIFGKKNNKNLDVNNVKTFGLNEFIEQFIGGLDNPFILSMFFRMLDTNSFMKFGQVIFTFTDEEKEKLEKIKPLLDDLVKTVSNIKKIQRGQ